MKTILICVLSLTAFTASARTLTCQINEETVSAELKYRDGIEYTERNLIAFSKGTEYRVSAMTVINSKLVGISLLFKDSKDIGAGMGHISALEKVSFSDGVKNRIECDIQSLSIDF